MKTKNIFKVVFILLLLGFTFQVALTQQEEKAEVEQAVTAQKEEGVSIRIPVRQMFHEAGALGWVISFVLALGLFLIFTQFLVLGVDRRRSKVVYNTKLQDLGIQEIDHLVKDSKGTMAGFIRSLLNAFHATGSFQSLTEEITLFNQAMQERFRASRNWLSFLSNSAGALGLLGTVLGMYVTFRGGILEHSKILNGMALALVTTLMGIVVSLILDLGSTMVNNYSNKNLDYSLQKSEEFRLALLRSPKR